MLFLRGGVQTQLWMNCIKDAQSLGDLYCDFNSPLSNHYISNHPDLLIKLGSQRSEKLAGISKLNLAIISF